ncbi:MAG TPA: hypothetical protein ENI96_01035 [Sedimenticola thiotaurini]|uniref:Cytochrome C n=1 Tax=Sedimenticola thiotaurini TaxID=1543721 RepID=A0A831RJF5_9GAMM|nr:hypothetical protein [Sedimenticola thiotaurini]
MWFRTVVAVGAWALLATGAGAAGQAREGSMAGGHMQHMATMGSGKGPQTAAVTDTREPVRFPPRIRAHELWSMRDHLRTLQKIQQYLAEERFEEIAGIAEQRLGMSSFGLHGAHESAPYMPEGMRQAGGAMHRSASRLARLATDAAVTGETKPVLQAVADLTARCVACHDAYRLE